MMDHRKMGDTCHGNALARSIIGCAVCDERQSDEIMVESSDVGQDLLSNIKF